VNPIARIPRPPPLRPAAESVPVAAPRPPRRGRSRSVLADGQAMIWLTGGALAIGLVMIVGLLGLVLVRGLSTFWPQPIERFTTLDGRSVLGQVTSHDRYAPQEREFRALSPQRQIAARELQSERGGEFDRWLVRTGNYEDTGSHFTWVSQLELRAADETAADRPVETLAEAAERPPWALQVERIEHGAFYGLPVAFLDRGQVLSEDPAEIWRLFRAHHGGVRDLVDERREIDRDGIGALNRRIEGQRLAARQVQLDQGPGSPASTAAWERFAADRAPLQAEIEALAVERERLEEEGRRYQLRFDTAYGKTRTLDLWDIVRAVPANQLGWWGSLRVYLARWWEFLSDEPREANSEGGVFPAIFGTVVMTLIMSLAVVPFGVLAALYLREYARPGAIVGVVRIAVNNLAGVPSIVFGVFGLGFFCYILGASLDDLLFEARLPNPTYGKGGLLWASLTLALLTLPVVIVATEEALAAVPSSMREGSYACGATKWQTIQRIVLPRALPGILTGMILAVARGAGEVAPLMLVGAVKLAPELPLDGVFPFVHPERSFMHLGFHIFDLGFQSQNSEAAKPMVFTTTLLLISIVVVLNVVAITVRTRLRRRFVVGHV
jgi:phosphate transport system permease protein